MFVSFYTTRILLQALGAVDFGIFNIVAGSINMLAFINASLAFSTQRFISYAEGMKRKEIVRNIFNTSLNLHLGINVFVIVIFIIGGFFFFNNVLNIPANRFFAAKCVYACMILTISFSLITVPYEAMLNAKENMFIYSILGIIEVVLKLIIAIIISHIILDKLIIYGFLYVFVTIISRLVMSLYCKCHYEECSRITFGKIDKKISKEMISFTGWNLINISSGMIALYGLGIVLNYFFGVILNAAMGISMQVSGALSGFSQNMMKAVTPIITKKEGEKLTAQMLSITLISSKFSFFLLSFFSIPICFAMNDLLHFWLKEVPEWTILFCRLQIICALTEQLTAIFVQAIFAHGEIKQYNLVRTFVNLAPIVVSVIMFSFIPELPPYWLLLLWIFFRGGITGIVTIYFSKRTLMLRLKDYYRIVLKKCLITIVFIVCCGFFIFIILQISEIQKMVILFVISLPIYWYVGMTIGERDLMKVLIRKRFG